MRRFRRVKEAEVARSRVLPAPATPPELTIHPLSPDRWIDLEALFGEKGASGGCWCMWWRVRNKDFQQGEGNKQALRSLVEDGTPSGAPPGLLGYDGETPVGWLALGPRSDFARFPAMTSDKFRPVDETPVWSIVCFFVTAKRRRQKVAAALLAGAVDWAQAQAIDVLEGYPVDTTQAGSTGSALMGTEKLFRNAGFVEVARRHPQRPIMRLHLGERPAGGPVAMEEQTP
jgi:GNAT superfamily N-acetyltransferase